MVKKTSVKIRELPELVSQVHLTLNENVNKILDLSIGSHKKIMWTCPEKTDCGCIHTYEMEIRYKSSKNDIYYCPYCDGTKYCKHQTFSLLYPELAKCWHPTKNGDFKIDDFSHGSHYNAWWICNDAECGCVHEYQQIIYVKIDSYKNLKSGQSHCTYCNGTYCDYHKSVAYLKPELLEEWDYEFNDILGLDPTKLSLNSNEKINWICKKGCKYKNDIVTNDEINIDKCKHRWKTELSHRISQNTQCPYCLISPQSCCYHQSISYLMPQMAKEFHPSLNGNTKPYELTPSSNKKVYWKCAIGCIHKDKKEDERCEHIWSCSVNSRTRNKNLNKITGCPFCVKSPQQICMHQSLGHLYPEYIEEWDNEKNIKETIFDISIGTPCKVWWKCKNKHENGENHTFELSPYERITCNMDCPYCRNKTINVLYDFLIQHFNVNLEKKFEWSRNYLTNRYLPFDIYIDELKLLIELDGDHHFKDIKTWNSSSDKRRYTDLYKMKLANDNKYSILRIVQIDIYYNSYDWKNELLNVIKSFNNDNIENKYICKRNEYNIYQEEFETFTYENYQNYMIEINSKNEEI